MSPLPIHSANPSPSTSAPSLISGNAYPRRQLTNNSNAESIESRIASLCGAKTWNLDDPRRQFEECVRGYHQKPTEKIDSKTSQKGSFSCTQTSKYVAGISGSIFGGGIGVIGGIALFGSAPLLVAGLGVAGLVMGAVLFLKINEKCCNNS